MPSLLFLVLLTLPPPPPPPHFYCFLILLLLNSIVSICLVLVSICLVSISICLVSIQFYCIGVNLFPRKLIRFPRKKGEQNIPIILLSSISTNKEKSKPTQGKHTQKCKTMFTLFTALSKAVFLSTLLTFRIL